MFIEWNSINSVNVKEIDIQHKILISIINRLDDVKNTGNLEAIRGFLDELKDYAAFHFATEEKYFAQFNYPATVEHKTEHTVYVEKINEFEKKYESEGPTVLSEILDFLRGWWLNHINSTDMQYSEFFNDHGLF
jgi:hemerythrin